MKVFLHDYGRYAFATDLAEGLAKAGHEVVYAYSELDTSRSSLDEAARLDNLRLLPIRGAATLKKASLPARYRAEIGHGRSAGEAIRSFKPDVVLSANTPLDAQRQILEAAHESGAAFVYWLQDILGLAMTRILPKKLPLIGGAVAARYQRLERSLLLKSDHVVAICEDFRDMVHDWGADESNLTVVENWAPALSEPTPRDIAAWRHTHGLEGKRIIMYAGTLGMKHSPEVLLRLAERLGAVPDARLVVVGEGPGVDWLRANRSASAERNLVLLPFEPLNTLHMPLAAADVLLALLEADAGDYCVPSKILTYMRAGKPILAAMPASNPASKRIERLEHGVRVNPADAEGLTEGALNLLSDPSTAAKMGRSAKEYADDRFSAVHITRRFEEILLKVDRSSASGTSLSKADRSASSTHEAVSP